MLLRQAFHLRVVDLTGRGIETVLHRVEELAREIHLRAVRQVSAMIEAHAEDGVARLDEREIGGGIRLRAGMRLHVGVVGAEELLGAVDGELLGDVDEFAAAVVTLPGVALRVLVRQHRALRLEDATARVVLGGDQLDMLFLARPLVVERRREFGIEPGDSLAGGKHHHSTVGGRQL